MVGIIGFLCLDTVPQVTKQYQVEITKFFYLSHNRLQINCAAASTHKLRISRRIKHLTLRSRQAHATALPETSATAPAVPAPAPSDMQPRTLPCFPAAGTAQHSPNVQDSRPRARPARESRQPTPGLPLDRHAWPRQSPGSTRPPAKDSPAPAHRRGP